MQRQLLTTQHQLPRQQRSERTQCLRSTTSDVPMVRKITAVSFPQLRRESRVVKQRLIEHGESIKFLCDSARKTAGQS